jgi:phosphoribosyl 1,2-cyclic phosphodiesterase
MRARFWGVRGTIPVSTEVGSAVGGHTSCVEVDVGGVPVFLDAGSGLRLAGKELLARGGKHARIFLSHTHWDHLLGFPFFPQLFDGGAKVDIYAGHESARGPGIRALLAGLLSPAYFPVGVDTFPAATTYHDLAPFAEFTLEEGARVKTAPLLHPGGATGYRIEHGGKSMAYVTDTEHEVGKHSEAILALIKGVDLFIYDATFTSTEYPRFKGWGHSTWEEGAALAELAGVKRYAIFHHEPDRSDVDLRAIEVEAKKRFAGSFLATESADWLEF